jgi:DNA helicase HerA-like ATPase
MATDDAPTILDQVRAGYAFDPPVLTLGALVDGGVARPDAPITVPLSMLNRHGLVAGATGTGKTKTLQVMAEQLSAHGVPVLLADIKGDLSGMAAPGTASDKVTERATEVGQVWQPTASPVEFFNLGGLGKGQPIRVTITSFGPILLSKVLGLNETQESSLQLIVHWADQQGLALLDLKDLRAVITHLTSDEGKAALATVGGVSKATAGVILRELTALEAQGADAFFGEPELDTNDLMRLAPDGRGIVSVLDVSELQDRPVLFSTFLMWLLADLFEDLPEVGDLDKPKLVFFFDEAHLLFNDASKAFLQAVTQTVRLIRSKGVGVYFVTQTPKDLPSDVLGQLGHRVQHALRAYTPDDAKALKATVSTFPKSGYDIEEVLTQLGIGEAVVTVLGDRGVPTPVAWTRLQAPTSSMQPAAAEIVTAVAASSAIAGKYATTLDRESAYERLVARVDATTAAPPTGGPAPSDSAPPAPAPDDAAPKGRRKASTAEVVGKAVVAAVATTAAREIIRGIFGTRRRR